MNNNQFEVYESVLGDGKYLIYPRKMHVGAKTILGITGNFYNLLNDIEAKFNTKKQLIYRPWELNDNACGMAITIENPLELSIKDDKKDMILLPNGADYFVLDKRDVQNLVTPLSIVLEIRYDGKSLTGVNSAIRSTTETHIMF